MNENIEDAALHAVEIRGRDMLKASVDDLDMHVRSRLQQARHAALEAALTASRRPWFLQMRIWTPAAGVAAAALLGAAVWFAVPKASPRTTAEQPTLEDLEMVASGYEGTGDSIDMLQNDLDFYDFADNAANSGPAA